MGTGGTIGTGQASPIETLPSGPRPRRGRILVLALAILAILP
jgi:hypothetical protein